MVNFLKIKSFGNEFRKNSLTVPSILLIFYAIPTTMCISASQGIIQNFFTHCNNTQIAQVPNLYIPEWLQSVGIYILHPIVGWLADTKLGRDKSISCSLWFCWCGIILHIVSSCFIYKKCDWTDWLYIVGTVLSILALILLIIGVACYQSCMLAYGLDQLPDASSNQVKKFIRWLTWSTFMGYIFMFLRDPVSSVSDNIDIDDNIVLGSSFVIFIIVSIALVLHGSFKHRFYPSGTVKHNPYSTVIQILKYAFKHKSPEDRSSLTYWEEHAPTRIDLAKNKYGGPFTESDVEDTKTFWRMVAIFCSLGGLFIPYFSTVTQGLYYGLQFIAEVHDYDNFHLLVYALWESLQKIGIIVVPVLDLIILPLFPKLEYFLLNSLKGLGLAMAALGFGLGNLLIIETVAIVQHVPTNFETVTPCFLKTNILHDNKYYNVSVYYFIIPWFFIGIAYFLIVLKSFEFICSQAPNEMCGLLTGVFWFIRSAYICIGAIISFSFTYLPQTIFPCTFWIIVAHFAICLCFLIIFALVCKWYQRRKKGEEFHAQSVIEKHYDKFLHPTYDGSSKHDLFSKYDIPLVGWSDSVIPVYPNK